MNPSQRQTKPVLLRNGNPQGNPMNAPRCGAMTRRGTACRAPAMANGRCRMHGGTSTGPRTPEGLRRSREARLKHGRYSRQAKERRKDIRRLMAGWTRTLDAICNGTEIPLEPTNFDPVLVLPPEVRPPKIRDAKVHQAKGRRQKVKGPGRQLGGQEDGPPGQRLPSTCVRIDDQRELSSPLKPA